MRSKLQIGEKAAKEAIGHLLLMGTLKAIAGLVTGMTVILADAISTFADTLGVFASYIGLRMSRKSASETFKYGYHKVETFAALFISIGIIYLGWLIFEAGVTTFENPEEGTFRSFAITTTVIAILYSYKLEKKLKTAGEKTNSLSLLANAKDKKMDMIAGVAVLASIVANYKGILYVEGVISMIIAVFILKEGVMSAKESLFFLLDYWNDPVLTRKIRKVFKQEKDLIEKVKTLKLRRAGTFVFGEAFVEINPFAGIEDLREELDILEAKIKEINPYIKDFAIYSHITKPQKVKIAVPIMERQGLSSKIARTLAKTEAYLFAEIKDNKIKKHSIKKISEKQKNPVQLASFLKKEKVNIVIDNKLNSLVYYNLRRTHHILIYPNLADMKRAGQAIEILLIDT